MREPDYAHDAEPSAGRHDAAGQASTFLRDYSRVPGEEETGVDAALHLEEEMVSDEELSAGDEEAAFSSGGIPAGDAPGKEIARLRRLLAEKDHAIIRTAVVTSELEQRVEEAQAEAATLRSEVQTARPGTDPEVRPVKVVSLPEMAKLKLEWRRAIKTLEQETNQRKAEIVQIRSQWHQTQRELEQVRHMRRVESSQASAKIANLERDLAVATTSLDSKQTETRNGSIRKWVMTAGAIAAVIMAALIGWSQLSPRTGVRAASQQTPQVTEEAQSAPVESIPPLRYAAPAGDVPVKPLTPQNFGGSLSRLNSALSNLHGRAPEEVLSEVRRKASRPGAPVCAFQWNGGQPALVYAGAGTPLNLATTLESCAAAVEKYK
jgi:hypothetical protein